MFSATTTQRAANNSNSELTPERAAKRKARATKRALAFIASSFAASVKGYKADAKMLRKEALTYMDMVEQYS